MKYLLRILIAILICALDLFGLVPSVQEQESTVYTRGEAPAAFRQEEKLPALITAVPREAIVIEMPKASDEDIIEPQDTPYPETTDEPISVETSDNEPIIESDRRAIGTVPDKTVELPVDPIR